MPIYDLTDRHAEAHRLLGALVNGENGSSPLEAIEPNFGVLEVRDYCQFLAIQPNARSHTVSLPALFLQNIGAGIRTLQAYATIVP